MRKTSSRTFRSAFLVFAIAIAVSAAGIAFAQQPSSTDIAQARELFNQGMRLREKGDASGAIEKLKAAHALGRTPITGLELGRTYEQTGKLVEARETLLSVGRLAVQGSETARSTAARAESARLAEQLRSRIPALTLKVTGVPAGTAAVTIDGAAVATEALDAPRPLDPGTHELVARSASGSTAQLSVDLKEGENRAVELAVVGASPAADSPVPNVPNHAPDGAPTGPTVASGTSPLVYIGLGLAGAGLVVGGVTGGLAISKASSVNSRCMGTVCPRTVDDDLKAGRTLGNVSTAGFIAAGAGAVVGVLGLFLSHHHHDELPKAESLAPWITPEGAGLQGSF